MSVTNGPYKRDANGVAYEVDFEYVRDNVPLDWFFEHMLGARARPSAGAIRYNICPNPGCGASSIHSVKVSVKNGGWLCYSCGEQGDVVAAAAFYWEKSHREAGLDLMGADVELLKHYIPPKPMDAIQRDDSALALVLQRVAEARTYPSKDALKYFAGRGISEGVAREACNRGILITIPNNPMEAKEFLTEVAGQELMVKAGLWNPEKKAPACAFRPLWFRSQSHCAAEFRLMREPKEGEKKAMRYGGKSPWIWEGSDSEFMIVEGPIDMLSAVEMGSKRTIFALPGCENWEPDWFNMMAKKNVLQALDPDKPGFKAAENLKPVLEALEVKLGTFNPPNRVGDLNEQLKHMRGLLKGCPQN